MNFRGKIRSKTVLFGTIVTLPSPEVVEILCGTGLDWLFIDLEHSAMETRDAQSLLQAAANRKPCLVRVSGSCELGIRKTLDSGAQGVILPQVNSRPQIEELVSWTKFSPLGRRSLGLSRASGYGHQLAEYLAKANDETAVVAQIEHIDAVNNIDEILTVANVDAIFVGPYDLSASMGLPGDVGNAKVQDAIDRVIAAGKRSKMALGIFCANAATANTMIDKGFTLIALASDALMLGRGIGEEFKLIKR
jgi:2-dehydro-3-deoxyglucarate aldolase